MTSTKTSLQEQSWLQSRQHSPEKLALARKALEEIRGGEKVFEAIRHHPLPGGEGYFGKSVLVAAYRQLVAQGEWEADPALLAKIRLKPMRTLSGVTTVTVLTKPYPCPGHCIFCPSDERMPKSYLPNEPGAMRALYHKYDPYEQVAARIATLHDVGHPTDKIELLVLGGSWSAYPRDYQEWFLRRCFEAMNADIDSHREVRAGRDENNGFVFSADSAFSAVNADPGSKTLEEVQAINETAAHRNVGLVVELRPDQITPQELKWLRSLGVTKVQMGAQSMDDRILTLNKRGHTAAATRRAMTLLRAAGFKVVLHWMPNLLGATPESDREDFPRLWDGLAPDEIKIYPTQLLAGTELYEYWQRGEYVPYTTAELVDLITDLKTTIPRYCRVDRVIRDIPSTSVVAGNKRTSLRQDVQRELGRRGQRCECIRCREVRGKRVAVGELRLDDMIYRADFAEEHFISFVTPDDRLAGFLRLSLPMPHSPDTGLADLAGAAIIREVHIYGQSLQVGEAKQGAAQHTGLGTRLLLRAEAIARRRRFRKLAVIAAVGTRRYYLERGFERGDLYLVKREA
ncbi:MAG: tRNA uridine(34) 5-carboxymethylaminomethyl modification radical SAM/GNAT enzyme Elp3 [Chloroflexi bacterium]|nr:tRNA uridine(34) 5-carboxymethylaminomethyl modification radical SAM/GNAT enzyme Elp3 [Chloroflexota bacterium]